MAKYQIYGIGAALVDTEVVVSDEFLEQNQIEKGVMTLVRLNSLMPSMQINITL
jgi:hypothetical protein